MKECRIVLYSSTEAMFIYLLKESNGIENEDEGVAKVPVVSLQCLKEEPFYIRLSPKNSK